MKETSNPPIDISKAESYKWGPGCTGWHLFNSNDLSIIQELLPKGSTDILHYHKNVVQFFYILKGEATFQLEEKTHTLVKNQGIEVQPMQSHCISNLSKKDLSILVISTPHSHCDRTNIQPI